VGCVRVRYRGFVCLRVRACRRANRPRCLRLLARPGCAQVACWLCAAASMGLLLCVRRRGRSAATHFLLILPTPTPTSHDAGAVRAQPADAHVPAAVRARQGGRPEAPRVLPQPGRPAGRCAWVGVCAWARAWVWVGRVGGRRLWARRARATLSQPRPRALPPALSAPSSTPIHHTHARMHASACSTLPHRALMRAGSLTSGCARTLFARARAPCAPHLGTHRACARMHAMHDGAQLLQHACMLHGRTAQRSPLLPRPSPNTYPHTRHAAAAAVRDGAQARASHSGGVQRRPGGQQRGEDRWAGAQRRGAAIGIVGLCTRTCTQQLAWQRVQRTGARLAGVAEGQVRAGSVVRVQGPSHSIQAQQAHLPCAHTPSPPMIHPRTPTWRPTRLLLLSPTHTHARFPLPSHHTRAGRSPKDKRVIREPESEKDVWWGQGG